MVTQGKEFVCHGYAFADDSGDICFAVFGITLLNVSLVDRSSALSDLQLIQYTFSTLFSNWFCRFHNGSE